MVPQLEGAIILSELINTSYLTDSYVIFTLKMESVSKNSRPLLNIVFKPKMVFLDTDFILRVRTMYESVQ